MKVLFIGNSHTYFNDMPAMFRDLCEKDNIPCDVTMIAHGGWFLSQHVKEPDVRFNILYGKYDYVVLQEHAHPFGPLEDMLDAAQVLCQWIREAGATPVAYMTWQQKTRGELQPEMSAAYERMAEKNQMLLAPVGQYWWNELEKNPGLPFFWTDGQHADVEGSKFAAKILFETIMEHYKHLKETDT